jgi:hypothetical protein
MTNITTERKTKIMEESVAKSKKFDQVSNQNSLFIKFINFLTNLFKSFFNKK